ncbi:radical SAM protein [candidate division TA06 bacterium]|uniref:Radical SAM protein n=1 Tax=candidate division TA06 bacterium TaxID=2250710 RepID=A0A933IDK7_UNCT6|nr:radical SAM protein [candidate division TA06 bacterium]
MKIVLLNPPGKKLYLRDNYCAKVSKTGYINPPVDLIVISGWLWNKHKLKAVDAIVQRLSPPKTMSEILAFKSQAAIVLTSRLSWPEDVIFLRQLKNELPDLLLIGCGDLFLANWSKEEWQSIFEAVIFDYTTPNLARFLDEFEKRVEHSFTYEGIAFKKDNGSWVGKWQAASGEYRIPISQHELFPLRLYRHPFLRRLPYTVVVSDFGCPYRCSFCLSGVLGYKFRPVSDVIEELLYLKSLGVKEIFFGDQCYGVPRERNEEMMKTMLVNNLKFGWGCYTRIDAVDKELLSLMKRAGCHTIVFGLESATPEICRQIHKAIDVDRAKEALSWCQKLKIQTVATFIFGLPGESKKECLKTMELAMTLNLDYASFNLATPRPLKRALGIKSITQALIIAQNALELLRESFKK